MRAIMRSQNFILATRDKQSLRPIQETVAHEHACTCTMYTCVCVHVRTCMCIYIYMYKEQTSTLYLDLKVALILYKRSIGKRSSSATNTPT